MDEKCREKRDLLMAAGSYRTLPEPDLFANTEPPENLP
jgi:hypothetical protein